MSDLTWKPIKILARRKLSMDADDTTLTSAVKYDTDSEHEGKTDNNAGTWI